ncbi:hypothetical protein D3C79_859210 [compost metagenome]
MKESVKVITLPMQQVRQLGFELHEWTLRVYLLQQVKLGQSHPARHTDLRHHARRRMPKQSWHLQAAFSKLSRVEALWPPANEQPLAQDYADNRQRIRVAGWQRCLQSDGSNRWEKRTSLLFAPNTN